jgi:hypothetical protein
MDGRAQAAYDYKAYINWMDIMGGGHYVRRARGKGRPPTVNEFKESGKWIDSIFKKQNVWVILMPAGQTNSDLIKAIRTVQDWRPVFINNHQYMYVDISTEKGNEIFNGIFNNKTIYPDEFSKKITTAYNLLHSGDQRHQSIGMQTLEEAIKDYPSNMTSELLQRAVRHNHLHPQIIKLCTEIVNDFGQNRDQYKTNPSYRNRLITAFYSYKILSVLDKANTEQYSKNIKLLSEDRVLNFKEFKW